jgi:hypothetical protein
MSVELNGRAIRDTVTRRWRGLPAAAVEAEHVRLAVEKKRVEERLMMARHDVARAKRDRVAPARWQQLNDSWDRAKRDAVALDIQLAALRPVLRAAHLAAARDAKQTRAQVFVAVARERLAPEVVAALWEAVEARVPSPTGLEPEEP